MESIISLLMDVQPKYCSMILSLLKLEDNTLEEFHTIAAHLKYLLIYDANNDMIEIICKKYDVKRIDCVSAIGI